MVVVLIGCIVALGGMTAIILMRAVEANRTGELRYWVRGLNREQAIRRADDPNRFDLELKVLRAVPWMGFTLLAIAVLMLGYFV